MKQQQNDVEKLISKLPGINNSDVKPSNPQMVNYFKKPNNKAKENTYTEEQVIIPDEQIDKQAELIELGVHRMFFKTGAKWYRQQLQSLKQPK